VIELYVGRRLGKVMIVATPAVTDQEMTKRRVCFGGRTGKLMLILSVTSFDPIRTPRVHCSTCEYVADFELLCEREISHRHVRA
jgi:hypothetical protein